MFIKSLTINNFRNFKNEFALSEGDINIPDGNSPGSGLTIFVGENGTGKTTLLDSFALPLLDYKSDTVSLNDFSNPSLDISIKLYADNEFEVKKCVSGAFMAEGFEFFTKLRRRGNSKYLSSPTTSDTLFYAPNSGIDTGSADLRTSVNNPFSGPRFNDNDFLVIDKNRTKQLESGLFSSTRFDRLLGDFNFQYIKKHMPDFKHPDKKVSDEVQTSEISNTLLTQAFTKFKEATGHSVGITFIDNKSPYNKAYLSYEHNGSRQLPVEKMGSGFQMLLALFVNFYLSKQSGKKLIVFIDEPELHLHHSIQKELAGYLVELSKITQIIIATHSAELLKDLANISGSQHRVNVLKEVNGLTIINPQEDRVMPSATVAETNYIAFGIPSMEYFGELYGQLSYLCEEMQLGNPDKQLQESGVDLVDWIKTDGSTITCTRHSALRHKIHHPENRLNESKFNIIEQLPISIEFTRSKIMELTR